MIYGYELIKLFSDEEKDKKSNGAAAVAGAGGLLGGAVATGVGHHAKDYISTGKDLKSSLKLLKGHRDELNKFKDAEFETTKNYKDLLAKSGVEMENGGSPLKYLTEIMEADDARKKASEAVQRKKGVVVSALKKTRNLEAEHIMHKKNLVKSLGKAAIAGGLAAGGVAAYNHFKNKDKNSK